MHSSYSLSVENQTFYRPQSPRCSGNRLRFLFVDFPRWSTSTSGAKKIATLIFTRTPAGISQRTLCYLMISGACLQTISLGISQRLVCEEGLALSLLTTWIMLLSWHLGTQLFYSNFPITPGISYHSC